MDGIALTGGMEKKRENKTPAPAASVIASKKKKKKGKKGKGLFGPPRTSPRYGGCREVGEEKSSLFCSIHPGEWKEDRRKQGWRES